MSELTPQDEADLAALADGRLDPARHAELEARLAAEPELAAALERQRTAVLAIRTAAEATSAPLALRARVEELTRAAAERQPSWRKLRVSDRPRGGTRRPGRTRPLRPLGALAAAAAAVVLAVVVVAGGGGLTVEEAAAAATRPPVARVGLDPREPRLLATDVEGVSFPNYAAKFGWRPVGTRTDEIEGRETRTVFYRRGNETIAYTIVAGDALDEPDDAPVRVREGTPLRPFDADGRTAVTWKRQGHTCVLSGDGVSEDTLLELAAWKGMGAVEF